ncbi:hypothetical protein NBRC111894_337 [Sporolactobacillus inulinus]|uniref:Uncharacterized protein n=1 Tax=Sporolactobacillus inulinus TaxID=2078 RepID=A0A4Y1Z6W3_9BACL|nr:hypothetical protein NBRC111894_337 [Sporolactobacillus inulinus]
MQMRITYEKSAAGKRRFISGRSLLPLNIPQLLYRFGTFVK